MTGRHAKKKDHKGLYKIAGLTVGGVAILPLSAAPANATAPLSAGAVTNYAEQGCPQLSSAQLDTAVKIAYAESGFNVDAWNQVGEDSRGLWQINRAAHGDKYGDLFDPLANAKAMCAISSGGTNWGPWTTFTSGRYKAAPGAVQGAPKPAPPAPAPPPAAKPAAPPQRVYTDHVHHKVEPGDTLSGISLRYLKDAERWEEVYDRNKAKVGSNPHLIFPGQDIRVDTPGKSNPADRKPDPQPEKGKDAHAHGYASPVDGRVSQVYGNKRSGYALGYHTGTDFAAPTGTPVKAISNGVVVTSDSSSAYGVNVQVKHDDGKFSLYAHLSGKTVKVGQSVKAGALVGYVGNTGTNSSGPHLHLEVRTAPAFGAGNFLDPVAYLRSNGVGI